MRDCRCYLEHARRRVYSPKCPEEEFSEVRIAPALLLLFYVCRNPHCSDRLSTSSVVRLTRCWSFSREASSL
jgi:hypothetical protein